MFDRKIDTQPSPVPIDYRVVGHETDSTGGLVARLAILDLDGTEHIVGVPERTEPLTISLGRLSAQN